MHINHTKIVKKNDICKQNFKIEYVRQYNDV